MVAIQILSSVNFIKSSYTIDSNNYFRPQLFYFTKVATSHVQVCVASLRMSQSAQIVSVQLICMFSLLAKWLELRQAC